MSYGDVCKEITPETGQTNRLESNQLKTQFMHPAATGATGAKRPLRSGPTLWAQVSKFGNPGHDDATITIHLMPFVLTFLLEWMTIYLFGAWDGLGICFNFFQPGNSEILQKL